MTNGAVKVGHNMIKSRMNQLRIFVTVTASLLKIRKNTCRNDVIMSADYLGNHQI